MKYYDQAVGQTALVPDTLPKFDSLNLFARPIVKEDMNDYLTDAEKKLHEQEQALED